MKKNVFKIGFLVGLVFILSGCNDGKANYEDKELTKAFIKNNKDNLNKINTINSFRQYELGRNGYGDLITRVYLSSFGLPYFDYGFKDCNYIMYIDSSTVEFLQDDIVQYGKETMYKEAQKCLNVVIKELEESEKNEIESKKQKEIYNEKLNKKFNENEVK